jgi:GT2 family glycosyltransferase
MDLTIAIPTYNRNELLLRHLAHLLPQLNERCRLLILDNCFTNAG